MGFHVSCTKKNSEASTRAIIMAEAAEVQETLDAADAAASSLDEGAPAEASAEPGG